MRRKWKKIVVRVVLVIIGLPVALVAALFAWAYASDKTNGSIVSSGVTRRYLLYLPKTYGRSKPAPLVISIHPAATWPAFQMANSRWNDIADEHGFIVVYPAGGGVFSDGVGRGPHVWHGGRTLQREVKSVSDLRDKLEADYNIDPNRVCVSGMSSGGTMAFVLSCELPDRIAAVGVVAPARPPLPGEEPCGDPKPVPTIAFHGTADELAPYGGGRSPIAPGVFPNIRDWTAHVAQRNQCKGGPTETRISGSIRRLEYADCAESADVVLYTVEGGGHAWPGRRTTDEINASSVRWEFFVHHPRGEK